MSKFFFLVISANKILFKTILIKVAAGRFWGHIGEPYNKSTKTFGEWENLLREAHNKIASRKRFDRIPGHDGEIKFLDVAKIAMKLFDNRQLQKR